MDLTAVFFNELGTWTDLSRTLLRISLILVIAWVMLAFSRRVIPMLRKQLQKHTRDPEQHKRLEKHWAVYCAASPGWSSP